MTDKTRTVTPAELRERKPASAVRAIVAELHEDVSDSQSDYFNHQTTRTVFLAWSTHTRDLFPELRQAAATFGPTAHLGPGRGAFDVSIVLTSDVVSNGSAYWKGGRTHWHDDLIGPRGWRSFDTEAAARAFMAESPAPHDISFGDTIATFAWQLSGSTKAIEHREKYSMGHGYYLKAGTTNANGWSVRKVDPGWQFDREDAIEVLEAPETAGAPAEAPIRPAGDDRPRLTFNAERGGVELTYPSKPSAETRERLKAHGWRWSRFSGCWYSKQSPAAIAFAREVSGDTTTMPAKSAGRAALDAFVQDAIANTRALNETGD